MGPPSHWPLPSHVTLLFLYKKNPPVPHSIFHTQMDDPVLSPEAQQVIDRLGQIRKQILDLVQPLRYQLPYQEVYRLRQEGIITPIEFQLLINPLFDPLA